MNATDLKAAADRIAAQRAQADASAKANYHRTLDAFVTSKFSIDEMLNTLQAMSDEHFNVSADDVTWADVGNITRTERQLREICDQLKKEGEYAK